MENCTQTECSTSWHDEESLRWWTFYISNYICASEGHVSYIFVFVLRIFLLLSRCIYLLRITGTLSGKCWQWSVSCCTMEIKVMKFIKWSTDTHSFLHYAKCKGKTLTTLAAPYCRGISPIYPSSPGQDFMPALGIRGITDVMGHNSPETHEIAPVFYQMVSQVSRNVFLLIEQFTSSSKSPISSANPQTEEHSALLLLVCFSKCIF